jgi:hypothetical protein
MNTVIVVIFNIQVNILLSGFKGRIVFLWHPLGFKTSKAAFHWGIVPAITSAAHTLPDFVSP